MTPEAHPRGYVCPRAIVTPRMTGRLDEDVWGHAPWTEAFVDIEGDRKPLPLQRTRAKMLWDDECLYIGAYLEEKHVWGTLTEHDCVIYQDNDFEVFLDPNESGQHYVELELNVLNTTWDLLLTRPYRAGGFAINGWEFDGLRTAVHIDGTLNDPTDEDRGWSVEIAIPWASVAGVAKRDCPPKDGDQWRINFSRVEWQHTVENGRYCKVPNTPEYNWVWSPQDAIDMHRPERWGLLQFSNLTSDLPPLRPLDEWDNRRRLVTVWEAQKAFRERSGRFAADGSALGLDLPGLTIEATSSQFVARLGSWQVDHELRFSRF